MALPSALPAVATSLKRLLDDALRPQFTVVIARAEDLDRRQAATSIVRPGLSVLLYRVDPDPVMRASWSARAAHDRRGHLPVHLRYLLTAWGDNADEEHLALALALRAIDETPILSGPLLDARGGWAPAEAVQLAFDELTTDELVRVFDALGCTYRASIPLVARTVVIEGAVDLGGTDVQTAVTGLRPTGVGA